MTAYVSFSIISVTISAKVCFLFIAALFSIKFGKTRIHNSTSPQKQTSLREQTKNNNNNNKKKQQKQQQQKQQKKKTTTTTKQQQQQQQQKQQQQQLRSACALV